MTKAPRATTGLRVVETTAPQGRPETMKLDDITLSPEQQIRTRSDPDLIGEYAEAMLRGDQFPPIVLYEDPKSGHRFLADGFHRHGAVVVARHKNPNRKATIDVIVFVGDFLDAVRHAVRQNSTHGRRLTEDDFRHVYRLIETRGGFHATTGKTLVDEVVATLGCSQRAAYTMTEPAREAMLARRDRAIIAMHREGKSQAAIAKDLDVTRGTVGNVVDRYVKICSVQKLTGQDDDSSPPPHAPKLVLGELQAPAPKVAPDPEPVKQTSIQRSEFYSYDFSDFLPSLNRRLIDAAAIAGMEEQTAPVELFEVEPEAEQPSDSEDALTALNLITEMSESFLECLSADRIDHLVKPFSAWRAVNALAALRAVAEFSNALADFIEERNT